MAEHIAIGLDQLRDQQTIKPQREVGLARYCRWRYDGSRLTQTSLRHLNTDTVLVVWRLVIQGKTMTCRWPHERCDPYATPCTYALPVQNSIHILGLWTWLVPAVLRSSWTRFLT